MKRSYILLDGALNHLPDGIAKIGDTVFECAYYDYGLSRDDTNLSGEKYTSMTLNENGDYPLFTVPIRCLQKI